MGGGYAESPCGFKGGGGGVKILKELATWFVNDPLNTFTIYYYCVQFMALPASRLYFSLSCELKKWSNSKFQVAFSGLLKSTFNMRGKYLTGKIHK